MQISKYVVYPAQIESLEVEENKNSMRILKYLCRQTCETGDVEINASYKKITQELKMYPDSISKHLDSLVDRKYITVIRQGNILEKKRSIYAVNWKGLGINVKEYIEVYKLNLKKYNIAVATVDDIDSGKVKMQGVRGRFDDSSTAQAEVSKKVYSTADVNMERIMSHIKNGNFDSLSNYDIRKYFSHMFWSSTFKTYYNPPGIDLTVLKKLEVHGVTKKDLVLIILWLFKSKQTQFKNPTINLLGTGWFSKMQQEAHDWRDKVKQKKIIQSKEKTMGNVVIR